MQMNRLNFVTFYVKYLYRKHEQFTEEVEEEQVRTDRWIASTLSYLDKT